MFARLTAYTKRFATYEHAQWWLFFYAVIESVFFPIPPDVILIPLALANRHKALFFATITTIGSVAGGVIGYAIGYFAFQPLALPVLEWLCQYSPEACPDHFVPVLRNLLKEHGLWVIGVSAMSPIIPYRFTILVAGMGQMALGPFIAMSFVAHWVRYAALSWAVAHYGRKAIDFIRQRMTLILVLIGIIALVVYGLVLYF